MQPVISIRHLFKSYGKKQVLNDINLEVFPGQVIGYIGPNGAGKSTTVKILCGLITDYEGEVYIQGLDPKAQTVEVKRRVGYVPELAELYDVLTPMEFLQFAGALHELEEGVCRDRIIAMMTAFGLYPNLNQRMDTFSKGMRQKVLIASGLLHNPDIIILDEPLSGLDANSVILVKELIARLAQEGKTIFYCSHMMDVVEKVSDRIVVIDAGQKIADGTFAELKQQQGNNSLEQIFARLTAPDSHSLAVADFLKAFKKDHEPAE
jgi:ABC-2 type transport system ATP-binding protein